MQCHHQYPTGFNIILIISTTQANNKFAQDQDPEAGAAAAAPPTATEGSTPAAPQETVPQVSASLLVVSTTGS
jgi:hypothetical protein